MTQRTCNVVENGELCDKPVSSRGMCGKHYQRWQNNGDPLISRRPLQKPTCTECGEPSYQKSLCLKHYRVQQAADRGPCSVEGCDEPWKSNGLCGTHYTRWRRTGSTDAPAPSGRPCSVENCDERTRAREYCQKHYRLWRKYGTPVAPKRKKVLIPCSENPCDSMAVRKNGMCDYHYRKARKAAKPRCAREGCEEGASARSAFCGAHGGWSVALTRAYGINADDYYSMLEAQGGTCAVCDRYPEDVPGRSKRLVIDHDHKCCPGSKACGKCVRGLLCGPCNQMLGLAGDDPELLAEAIAYLERRRSV